MSSKVSPRSSAHFLIDSFSREISSSMSSILWFSLVMFISPYSNLPSAALYFCWIWRIFVLELLLTLHSLLGGLLQLLHVLTNGLQFILDVLELVLGQLGALDGALQLILLHAQLPAQLVQLLLVVGGHLGGGAQVFVVLLDGDLVVHALGLVDLDFLHDLVGLLGGEGQLGDGVGQVLLRLLGLLLHQHDPTGEGGHVGLDLLEVLLLLLEGLGGLDQLVVGLVEPDLQLLHFLAVVTDVAVSLFGHALVLLGGLLELVDGGVEPIRLPLQALHLLSNGVHVG